MYNFLPFMTNDFSVGLFDTDTDDIYHSAFGALTEAKEKFINNIDFINIENKKILDICYGVGYNTKVLLNEIISKNKTVDIDCVDINKTLIELSPFISSKIPLYKRFFFKKKLYKNIQNYNEAKKIVKLKKSLIKYKVPLLINFILLKEIIEKFNNYSLLSDETEKILYDKNNLVFFDDFMLNFYKFLSKKGVYLYQNKNKTAFVHNIYYQYISFRYKYISKYINNTAFNLNFYNIDIRKHLLLTDKTYDIVLLDGFTPQKCPCIWSLDLFKLLSDKLSEDGIIITYNKSAPVRNAMLLSGFYVGNTFDKNNQIVGTICSKNKNLIKNELTESQTKLLETKAGIPYRDSQLSLDNGTILMNRLNEIKTSNLISSSKFFKEYKNEI